VLITAGTNVFLVGVQAQGLVNPALVWGVIDDNQTPNWQNIDNSQATVWDRIAA
jgi:hypothetical protein